MGRIQWYQFKPKYIYWILLFMYLRSMTVEGVRCDPGEHKYYHPQADECMDCETCNPGKERIPLGEWEHNISENGPGPTICRPCRTCGNGTYSDERAFQCKACRICSDTEVQVSGCTSTKNTVCSPKPKTETSKKLVRTTGKNLEDRTEDPGKGNISLIVILLVVTIVIVGLLGLLCRKWNPRGSKDNNIPINTMELGGQQGEKATMPVINTIINIDQNHGTINYIADHESCGRVEQIDSGETKCQAFSSNTGDNDINEISADDESSQLASVPEVMEESLTFETSEEDYDSDPPSEDTEQVLKPFINKNSRIFQRQNSYPFDETIPKHERKPFANLRS